MLISMPTGTSTIFGAFQAIVALLKVKPDEFRPFDKVIQIRKFASGIFSRRRRPLTIVHCTIFSGLVPGSRQTNDASRGSSGSYVHGGSTGPLPAASR